jgi:hypothetical protein
MIEALVPMRVEYRTNKRHFSPRPLCADSVPSLFFSLRSAAMSFAPSRYAMPFEIAPPRLFSTGRPEVLASGPPAFSAHPLLHRLPRSRLAAPCLAASRCGRQSRRAGTAATVVPTSDGRPKASQARYQHMASWRHQGNHPTCFAAIIPLTTKSGGIRIFLYLPWGRCFPVIWMVQCPPAAVARQPIWRL